MQAGSAAGPGPRRPPDGPGMASFERVSVESEGRGSNSSRDEIAAKLPQIIQDVRSRGGHCPFLHGSTLDKRLLYLGDVCCLHEVFMACCMADTVTMVAERRQDRSSDELLLQVQGLIPGWCSSLGLPSANLTLVMGSAMRLEEAGIVKESMDIVIGCSVFSGHSAQDLDAVLKSVFDCLVPGGEFSCSEVLSDRRLCPDASPSPPLLLSGLSTTVYAEDLKRLAHQNGFTEARLLNQVQHVVEDEEARAALGNAKLFRATVRMFKLPLLETSCEDYGQLAVYKGTIPECEREYQLDLNHVFVANQPKLVCGNTAAILGDGGVSWLHPHFHIQGDRSVHYGLFSGNGLLDQDETKDKCCG